MGWSHGLHDANVDSKSKTQKTPMNSLRKSAFISFFPKPESKPHPGLPEFSNARPAVRDREGTGFAPPFYLKLHAEFSHLFSRARRNRSADQLQHPARRADRRKHH